MQKLIEEMKLINSDFSSNPILFRLLESNLPHSVKSEVLRKLENTRQESENSKFNTWIEALLRIPFGKHKNLDWTTEIKNNPKKANKFFKDAEKKLDAVVYGHQPAKHKILQFIGQMVKNNTSNGLILGIQGPCGNGKTTLIEKGVSDIVGLPFAAIPLGGASDGCFLNGHSYTYEGSLWGQIADVLMKTGVMNPIIYMDELDKIAKTPKGDEIVTQLVHLIDACQNKPFQDRYFGNINIQSHNVR